MEKNIIEIAKKIEEAGGRMYLVGGAVRDEIMHRPKTDEDYCVTGLSQEEFEALFPEAILRGKDFAVYDMAQREIALARTEKKLGQGHKEFEVHTDKKITIEQDLKRRDITINSIAKDVLTGEYIDPFSGIEDIQNQVIRMTSEAFQEDPLRVYRVARFSAVFHFAVEEETIKQMRCLKHELPSLSKERVFQEFKKALASDMPSAFFEILRRADVLEVHFKEIYDLIGKIQPKQYHPEGDSFQHTMLVVDTSCQLTKKLEVRFSCLVHDLGKGATPLEMLPHHYGHEERGVKLIPVLSKRIGVPKIWEQCGKVSAKEHTHGDEFEKMTPKKQIEFIERVAKSPLGLDGMKVVVQCDQSRGNRIEEVIFDKIGEECLKQIDGAFILKKYPLLSGIAFKQKLHEERIKWLKNRENRENF